jgi:hypothetical protein
LAEAGQAEVPVAQVSTSIAFAGGVDRESMATDDMLARLKALSDRLERHRRQAQEVRTYIVNSRVVNAAADRVAMDATRPVALKSPGRTCETMESMK